MALRIAVLLSGSGTTLANLIAERDLGRLDVDFSVVISSKPETERKRVPAVMGRN